MDLFKKPAPPQNEYLKRFTNMAQRFQNIGIVVVLAAILLHYFGNPSVKMLALAVFAVGAICLVFGGSNLVPHNVIKSFAVQCSHEPSDMMAEGLLEAMERSGKTSLTKTSLRNVHLAIEEYAACEDADPELVVRLRQAAEKHLSKKIF